MHTTEAEGAHVNDIRVIHGDCIEEMRAMPDASIDAIVTDPPYGLGFMGKAWDGLPPGEEWARECLRVLKPGGHLLAFGGTRTWHRLAVAVEDAGFEIRDSIAWLYGSGFPKSLDVGKALVKAGADEAEQWQGWGTALKPAFEPIVVGRKPLAGTVAANVLAHGTGALNIDGNRTGTELFTAHGGGVTGDHRVYNGDRKNGQGIPAVERGANPRVGRWPTNVVLDDNQAAELDRQSGVLTSPATYTRSARAQGEWLHAKEAGTEQVGYGDSGGASRFFPTFKYQAKAPASERPKVDGIAHPTVKPLGLMRWLVRLVTPPGGVVLDPFAGSGTTIEAALLEGFDVIGIEREAEYLPLIDQRIARASA